MNCSCGIVGLLNIVVRIAVCEDLVADSPMNADSCGMLSPQLQFMVAGLVAVQSSAMVEGVVSGNEQYEIELTPRAYRDERVLFVETRQELFFGH